jgi:hypothetical protein
MRGEIISEEKNYNFVARINKTLQDEIIIVRRGVGWAHL